MTKFAVIQLRNYVSIDKDTFQQKFKTSELKKRFKCKKILELKNEKKDYVKEEVLSKISKFDLNQLSRNLHFTDLDDLSEFSMGLKEKTKIFIFSEDACSSAFAFDLLKDAIMVKLFSLNDQNINKFLNCLDVIKCAEDTINSLIEAKDQCESLSYIECDLNISLLHSDAIDLIENKISELEKKLVKSKKFVEDVFKNQWN